MVKGIRHSQQQAIHVVHVFESQVHEPRCRASELQGEAGFADPWRAGQNERLALGEGGSC
jgi:hypothetical protein